MAMGALEEIILAIEVHNRDHPTHGSNCVCMDDHVRRLRGLLQAFPSIQDNLIHVTHLLSESLAKWRVT